MQIVDIVLYGFLLLWAIMVVMVLGYLLGVICYSCKKCGSKKVTRRRSIDRRLFRLKSMKPGLNRKSSRKKNIEHECEQQAPPLEL